MKAQDIMTSDPTCCSPDTKVEDVAKLMAEQDCGEIPVVDSERKVVGVITDRDIVCRVVAQSKDPKQTEVRDVMSRPVVTATPETSVEDCCAMMEQNQIRRVPVVDQRGGCCGMVAQADIALQGGEHETAAVVRDVSRPTGTPSQASIPPP